MKPRILLTTRPLVDDDPVNDTYITALRSVGALVTIIPISEQQDIQEILSASDGLVVCGGRDIDPKYYGQEMGPATRDPHERLDASDSIIMRTAQEMKLPTLCICRGMQFLNVLQGGTLNQDISGKRADHHLLPESFKDRSAARHNVKLELGSWLGKTFGQEDIVTNSIHHQCIDELGKDLKIVARASDGTIEAIESTTDWFSIGVQWHPELFGDPTIIFKSFIDQVKEHRILNDRRE